MAGCLGKLMIWIFDCCWPKTKQAFVACWSCVEAPETGKSLTWSTDYWYWVFILIEKRSSGLIDELCLKVGEQTKLFLFSADLLPAERTTRETTDGYARRTRENQGEFYTNPNDVTMTPGLTLSLYEFTKCITIFTSHYSMSCHVMCSSVSRIQFIA